MCKDAIFMRKKMQIMQLCCIHAATPLNIKSARLILMVILRPKHIHQENLSLSKPPNKTPGLLIGYVAENPGAYGGVGPDPSRPNESNSAIRLCAEGDCSRLPPCSIPPTTRGTTPPSLPLLGPPGLRQAPGCGPGGGRGGTHLHGTEHGWDGARGEGRGLYGGRQPLSESGGSGEGGIGGWGLGGAGHKPIRPVGGAMGVDGTMNTVPGRGAI